MVLFYCIRQKLSNGFPPSSKKASPPLYGQTFSARQRNFTNLFFPSAKRSPSLFCWSRPAQPGTVFPLTQQGPQPSRWWQAVSWRLCRLETARALRALRRLTDGACILRVKPLFLLWEKWDVFNLQLVFLSARLGIVFPLAQRGSKPLFLLLAKEKAVLDSEKEKIDRWRLWGGTIQPDVGFVLLWGPSGKRL